ncbi:MAG: hypothetical protein ACRDRN_25300 [Sciscionella sp.]
MTRRNTNLAPDTIRRLTTNSGPWMSCDECFDEIDRYIDTVLAGDTRISPQLRAHLTGCGACFEEAWSLLLLAAGEQQVNARQALERMKSDLEDDQLSWPDPPINGDHAPSP